jgi:succinate-acetate transporter protein
VATFSLATVQLGWIPADQTRVVALGIVGFAVPLQLIACVLGFVARDVVAGTGTGTLAGTWLATALTTLGTPAAPTHPALGVLLLGAAAALVVTGGTGLAEPWPAVVYLLAAARFAVTGVYELTGSVSWQTTAGVVGLALAVAAVTVAAVEIRSESTRGGD